jgi:hypothetical protein
MIEVESGEQLADLSGQLTSRARRKIYVLIPNVKELLANNFAESEIFLLLDQRRPKSENGPMPKDIILESAEPPESQMLTEYTT